MPAPTPNVATPPDFLELPGGGTYQFDGTGSTVGASYQWTLVEKPPEATSAQLTNATTATPTLINITARGTYIVFLKVTNSFGESHPYPYPTQATTAPYGFSTPLATAFGVLRIAEAGSDALNPIFKPGRGEYGWFEKGLWPLVKKVGEGLTFEYYDIPTRTLTANAIVPDASVSPFATAVSVAGLNVRNDSANSEHELYNVYDKINVLSNMHVTGKDLTVSGGVIHTDEIRDSSGGALLLAPNDGLTVTTTDLAVTLDDDADITALGSITLTAEEDAVVAATALARLSGTTTEVIGVQQINLITDDGNLLININGTEASETVDRSAQLTFASANKRRVIDLDGFVAQRNHVITAGGSATVVTPNGTPTLVPLRGGFFSSYMYEALCGSSATPAFALNFHAAFIVTQFTTNPGNTFTLSLVAYADTAPADRVTLASIVFSPGGSIEVTNKLCIMHGTVHAVGGKNVYAAATGCLQLSSNASVTLLSGIAVNASTAFVDGADIVFAFVADSNDADASIGNVSATFSLVRGS